MLFVLHLKECYTVHPSNPQRVRKKATGMMLSINMSNRICYDLPRTAGSWEVEEIRWCDGPNHRPNAGAWAGVETEIKTNGVS